MTEAEREELKECLRQKNPWGPTRDEVESVKKQFGNLLVDWMEYKTKLKQDYFGTKEVDFVNTL